MARSLRKGGLRPASSTGQKEKPCSLIALVHPLTRLPCLSLVRQGCAFPTASEALLWRELRGKRLGVQFVRQAIVGGFIVDFLAREVRLVVEVDGGYHAHRRSADDRRDAKLARWGYRVVRVEAEVVVRQLRVPVERIRAAIASVRAEK